MGWGWVAVAVAWLASASAEVLTPPYFNIAEGRYVEASSTCGEKVEEPELYCKLTGTNQDSIHPENLIIQGQACDWCNQSNPAQRHPAKYAVDGSENFWMSPPLSRGTDYNQVNFTIYLGQEFHVSYVLIKMGNSPRPGIWILERSADNGETYKPWQYFADSPTNCERFFGKESLQPITSDDSVTCETSFSKIVPLQGGEIVVSLINHRPSANDFFNSPVLQEFTRATNVRLRFIRTKTLLGHLMSIAREDPSVTRRYFYSIKDISIGGRCRCNGHADVCDETHPTNPYKLLCRCKHNTTGENCERCQENMVQKAWRQSKPNKLFVCEACNCHGHSGRCFYNETVDELSLSMDLSGKMEGGGQCIDCLDNTMGINCEQCLPKFYRPFGKSQNDIDACQPCPCNDIFYNGKCSEGDGHCECDEKFTGYDCDQCAHGYFGYPNCIPCFCNMNGTDGGYCEPKDGVCPCKENFSGIHCRECTPGWFNYPECEACECNRVGSLSDTCDLETGKCECNSNYGGDKCDICADGYYDFPQCGFCSCDYRGTEKEICDKEAGNCHCKEGYGGGRCDQCLPGYYGFPDCKPCLCSDVGSTSKACDASGKCNCLSNYAGQRCDRCVPGYFNYPECNPCNCDSRGSEGISCDDSGKCSCKELFIGAKCDSCLEGRFNFPLCEECSCHPAGIVENFPGCGNLSTIGQLCQCKPRVQGRTCDQCRPLYWDLEMTNPHGCQECDCYEPGVIGGLSDCDSTSGKCNCKPFTTSRRCDTCIEGMFQLKSSNLFGCTDCGCDLGGSENRACDTDTGQCLCRARITNRQCSEPAKAHYFPTLHQFQYEAENGTTPDYKAVRYGFENHTFPGFSWKGYVVFSNIQDELVHEVKVLTQTIYRLILRYINPNDYNVKLTVVVSPADGEDRQTFEVILKPTTEPQFITLPSKGGIPAPLVMDPGIWNILFQNNKPLFLDYFVLLPAAYYEGSILVDRVVTPCKISDSTLCMHFRYPSVNDFDVAPASLAYSYEAGSRKPPYDFFPNQTHLIKLRTDTIPMLSEIQPELTVDMRSKELGDHVLLISYTTEDHPDQELDAKVKVRTAEGTEGEGKVTLPNCPYTWLCRQVVLDPDGKVAHFDFDSDLISVTLKAQNDGPTGLESVIAIPSKEWSMNYILPKPVCVMKDGVCLETKYFTPLDFKKLEFETSSTLNQSSIQPPESFDNSVGLIYLDNDDSDVLIKAKVPQPGEYVFILHYYQPNFPEYIMDVVVEDGQQSSKASVMVGHCPSNSGCRTTIYNSDGTMYFQLVDNVNFTFKQPPHSSVWLDYVLLVPASKYNDRLITEEPIDQTLLFLKECGKNFFHMDNKTVSDFCRAAVFSVTVAYNEGALPCKCNTQGSLSLQCNQFGGQCPCRHEHIIGRQCDECQPGYYHFPDCLPCDCPAICNEHTGECECPPYVVGELCDRCENYTFGYHHVVGCEPCDCNPLGVRDNDLQCDADEGICNCKENVEGRKCNHCSSGYYAFPDCEQCDCDLRGTTPQICEQDTANCICKENVDGQACDICKDGTFNLQHKNPEGCTKCFCFGRSSRCSSSRLYRSLIADMTDWKVAGINSSIAVDIETYEDSVVSKVTPDAVAIDLTEEKFTDKVVYLAAPKPYLGKQLTAYGGYLRYSLFLTTGPFGSIQEGPDVVIQGGDTHLLYFSAEQPAATEYFNASVEVIESNFILPNGAKVSRERLMMVLVDLQAIYIKASYWKDGVTSRLASVTLDSGSEDPTGLASGARSVEQCQCPPSYRGLSCEECAPGFFRAPTGPFGGFCIPCSCNGHATDCDKVTGKCIDCQNNTVGDHCEMCAPGYNGDATIGNQDDCLICPCPLPIKSNNFAAKCDMTPGGILLSCSCDPGYTGSRCEFCDNGFYGQPEYEGDFCKPCNCNGNIDIATDNACDHITGKCYACLNNASGDSCERCKPWFFGDAVESKNCQACDCNECGSIQCNHTSGVCDCKENVLGEKCDRCEVNHYGFNSCQGCLPCNCDVASTSQQCEPYTGQCSCKPGITGRTCNKCAPGHWNYTTEGCTKCECKEGYSENVDCDPVTGQCQCLPGVLGPNCDHCPEMTVLDPELGCLPCDSCVESLVRTTQELGNILGPFIEDFRSVNSSFYLNQRLNYLDKEVIDLNMNVDDLEDMKLDIDPIENTISGFKSNVTGLQRSSQYDLEKAESAVDDNFINEVKELQKTVDKEVEGARKVVDGVIEISQSFDEGKGKYGLVKSEFDAAIAEAQGILDQLQEWRPMRKPDEVKQGQLARSNECYAGATAFKAKADIGAAATDALAANVTNLDARIEDLKSQTDDIKVTLSSVLELNEKNRNAKIGNRFKELKDKEELANSTLANANELILNTTLLLAGANNHTYILNLQRGALENLKKEAQEKIENAKDIDELRQIVDEAKRKAQQMSDEIDEISQLNADTDLNAVSAYKVIIDTIRDALIAANESSLAAEDAVQKTEGIEGKTSELQNVSNAQYNEARSALVMNQELEEELKSLKGLLDRLSTTKARSQDTLLDINNSIDKIDPTFSIPELSLAESYSTKGQAIGDSVKDIVEEIPKTLNASNELHKLSNEAKVQYDLANKQLDQAVDVNKSKEARDMKEQLMNKSEKIAEYSQEMKTNLNDLKKQIEQLREVINNIPVGLEFEHNSILELRKPSTLPMDEISNYISLYFKTEENNGLLFFLGNEKNTGSRSRRSTSSNEFICLEIQSGYPKLTIDLGNGLMSWINSKYVADDNWYKAVIDRTGKIVKLEIHWEEKLNTDPKVVKKDMAVEHGMIEGNNTILNLDKSRARLFVGGFPNSFRSPYPEMYNSFRGSIEEFKIGDEAVGLWNYVQNENAKTPIRTRDSMYNTSAPSGLRFNGEGYVLLDKQQYKMREKTSISMHFKTFGEEGLLFLSHKEDHFLSIEIRKGQVLFQFRLGGDAIVSMASSISKGINDGEWHSLEAARLGKIGSLKVDGIKVSQADLVGTATNLRVSDHLFVGGYPNGHNILGVTRRSFDGCIKEVQIGGTSVDLSQITKASGVVPGCPEKVAKMLTFEKGTRGYAGLYASLEDSEMELILKFKTDSPDGVLAFLTDGAASSSMLELVDGQLVLNSGGQLVRTDVINGYNDSNWHVVVAKHSKDSLQLFIDDYQSFLSAGAPGPIRLLHGRLYIGGVPSSIDANAALRPSFSGCVGQATLNNYLFNLANLTDASQHVAVGKCLPLDSVGPPPEPYLDMPPGTVSFKTDDNGDTATAAPELSKDKLFDHEECKLPLHPDPMPQKPKLVGYRYGTKQESRVEYSWNKYNKNHFTIALELNTRNEEGLILFASDDLFEDYIAMYLKNQKVHFKIKCGLEQRDVNSPELKFDKWTEVMVTKTRSEVVLKVDGSQVDEAGITCPDGLPLTGKVFLGAVSADMYIKAVTSGALRDVGKMFKGCLKNLRLDGNVVNEPVSKIGVIPCSINYENGVYFSPEGGYIKHFDKFNVGAKMTIEMEIKARSLNGLLLTVHTPRRDYLVLELVNGSVRLATDNGNGEISTVFAPADPAFFCDGKWHKIKAIKIKHVVTVAVDNKQGENGVDRDRNKQPTADTKHPLFLGGRPPNQLRGIKSRGQFVGCMRSVYINDEIQDISVSNAIGNVTVGVCPTS